jgi:transcriptional regulator with XRE-family HTH domain
MRRRKIVVGREMARLRSEQNWTQEILAARLQCEGVEISRQGVARIELGHARVNEDVILGLQKVFRVQIVLLFPKEIQELDDRFSRRAANHKMSLRNAKG